MELEFAKSFVYLHHEADVPFDIIRPSGDKQSLTVLSTTADSRDTSFVVDYCIDIHEKQDHLRVTSHFKHVTSQVLQGIHASIFSMSAGRCTYDRNRVASEMLDQLERAWSKNRHQYQVSYVFIGITDARCLDISNGDTIDGEILQKQGLDRFYEKVNDCSTIKELVIRGCSRPSLMSIRVEKSGSYPTCAFLSLIDLGPSDFTPNPLVELQSPTSINVLSKSFEVFMQVVRYNAQSTFNGYLPTDGSMLTRLTAGAIGQNCATTFIFHIEANKKHVLPENVQALKFAETARKIRCQLAPIKVDLRLPYYENKYRRQCDAIEEKEAYIRGLESEWESRLNEANAKLLAEQTEKERVLQHCQQLEDQLNAATNNLRQQYEETNAKMHREIELLKKQEALQVTRSEKNSVETQVLLRQANVQIAMLEDEKEIAVESQRILTKMLNHAKAETQRILMLNEQLQLAIHNQEKETQETVQALQRKLKVVETNYETLKHDHASAKAQMIMEGNGEVGNVQKKLDALESKHVELTQSHKKLETAHKQLEKDLEMAHAQLNAAVTMAEETQKQLDQRPRLSEETTTLRKDLLKLKLEKQQLKLQVEQLTEQLESTKLNTSNKPKGKNGKEIETNDDNDEISVKEKKPTKIPKKSKATTNTKSTTMDIGHNNDNNDDALSMAPSTKMTNTSKESKKNDQFNKKTSIETTDALSNSMLINNATSTFTRPPLHQVAPLKVDDNKLKKNDAVSSGDNIKKRRKLMNQHSTSNIDPEVKKANSGLLGIRIGFSRSNINNS